MEYFKVEVDPKVLTNLEWGSFIPSINSKFPRVFMIENGDAKLFINTAIYMWIAKDQFKHITFSEDTLENFTPAPNVGFSEGFILRALAIAQDPKLAKELV
jgi:hypothetical protein